MLRRGLARIGILIVVFIVAVLGFSYWINRGNTDMSADMGSAAIPRISFTTGEMEVNSIPGYASDMEITSVRDTVTPVKNYVVLMNLNLYEETIEKLTWQIYTLDGEECLQKETLENVEETVKLQLNRNGMLDSEKVLKVTLHLPGKDLYYYTRIMDAEKSNYDGCVEFAEYFHENALRKTKTDELSRYLESVSGGNANGFQKVTLASSLDFVTWGSLQPELLGDVNWQIKECNEAYTSLQLSYQVKCNGVEDAPEAVYDVEEFLRVRIYGEQKIYLMDYERVMVQNFEGNKNSLDASGVLLGVAPDNVEYKHNQDEDVMAFVQNNELWHYDKKADELSLVFSFADSEKDDMRHRYNRHEVHVESIDENGNMLFHVLGYMNRGMHEGEVGVTVYYFDSEKNSIIERAFVPSKKGYEIMKDELGKFVHYSEEQSTLYVMVDGCLYRINMEEDTKEVLVRGLSEEQYMVSEDGTLLVYQNTLGNVTQGRQIKFLNLETGMEILIEAEEGEAIRPIGFMNGDLIYGYMRRGEEDTTATGENILPMYKLEIITQEEKVVKEYQIDGIYIQDATIDESVLTLQRVTKNENGYQEATADYITSNEAEEESDISLVAYSDAVRGVLRKLKYASGLKDTDAKILKPKQVLQENLLVVPLDEAKMEGKYYVYAFGHLQKTFDKAGEAIRYANQIEAIAVSSKQAYIFERGNWPNAYEVSDMEAFSAGEEESTMEACIRKIFEKEGVTTDFSQDFANAVAPQEILNRYSGGEGLELSGCTMEELQYIVSQDTPVIAVIGDNKAVLITGYNKTNIAYLDPASGERCIVKKEEMQSVTSKYGDIFIGYVK